MGDDVLPDGLISFGSDANCTLALCPIESTIYGYRPSLPANAVFIGLFGLAGLIHLFLGIRRKTWWFMSMMVVMTVCACLGYAGRIWLYFNPFSFNAFLIQMICITIGPVWYCGAVYVTLGQTIQYFSPSLSRIRPAVFYFGFITCDIIALVLQAGGGALSASSDPGNDDIGVDLSIAGLAFQVATILTFISLLIDFIIRYFRSAQGRRAVSIIGIRLKLFFGFLFTAMLLTIIRSTYRLVELRQGYNGALIKEEAPFIALEGVLVVLAVYCLAIAHPGLIFKEHTRKLLTSDSTYSTEGIEMQDEPNAKVPARR